MILPASSMKFSADAKPGRLLGALSLNTDQKDVFDFEETIRAFCVTHLFRNAMVQYD